MSEYIVYESESVEATDYRGNEHQVCHYEKREEIVRCRDCRYEMNNECTRIDEWVDELWFPIEPDGFCKWGERKIKRKNGLEPCPFCGSEVAVRYEPNCDVYYVHCDSCGAETGNSGLYRERSKAIEAWNTRAERTCHEVLVDKHWRGCAQCGYKWEFMYGIAKCERPNYCPNCGARITEEGE